MKMRPFILYKLFWFVLMMSISNQTICQVILKKNANDSSIYISPLKVPPNLTGSFMEPRPGAYHMGIDLAAPEGTPVHASADGYVWRLRLSPYGYGRAVYIKHYGGTITVYGHLSRFSDSLDAYLKHYQIARQTNEVDIFPDSLLSNRINIKKDDIIGYVGNAGQSTGMHLHYEIRDGRGETYPYNPLDFSTFGIIDHTAPVINFIALYDGHYTHPQLIKPIQGQTIVCHYSKIWLGVVANDINNAGHLEALKGYSMTVDKDSNLVFFQIDKKHLDFKYIGNTEASIDFNMYQKGTLIYRLHKLPFDESVPNSGTITMKPNQMRRCVIKVYDNFGNLTTTSFILKGATALTAPPLAAIEENKARVWNSHNAIITFPAHTSYIENYPKVIDQHGYITIADAYGVLQKAYMIKLFNTGIPPSKKDLTYCIINNISVPVKWKKDTAVIMTSLIGTCRLMIDSMPPIEEPDGISYRGTKFKIGQNMMESVSMTDTLKSEKYPINSCFIDEGSGIDKYDLFVDNVWTPWYYDSKADLCFNRFKDFRGVHQIRLEITDKVGNKLTQDYIVKNP